MKYKVGDRFLFKSCDLVSKDYWNRQATLTKIETVSMYCYIFSYRDARTNRMQDTSLTEEQITDFFVKETKLHRAMHD